MNNILKFEKYVIDYETNMVTEYKKLAMGTVFEIRGQYFIKSQNGSVNLETGLFTTVNNLTKCYAKGLIVI